jgi:adenylate kinase family enzyme
MKYLKRAVIVSGPPSCGKGTMIKKIQSLIENGIHLSTGDIFRAIVAADPESELGKYLDEKLRTRQLADDEKTTAAVSKFMLLHNQNGVYLFDGFPRTAHQAEWLFDEFMPSYEFDPDVLHLEICVTGENCVTLARSRNRGADDTEAIFRQGLADAQPHLEAAYRVCSEYTRRVQVQGYPRSIAEIAEDFKRHLIARKFIHHDQSVSA